MKVLPFILGAALIAPVGGAVVGKNIGTDPLGNVADVTESLPQRATIASGDARPRTVARMPNHYAMETPEGVIEVEELALRGRYRERWERMKAAEASFAAEQAAFDAEMAAYDAERSDFALSQAQASSRYDVAPQGDARPAKANFDPANEVRVMRNGDRRIAALQARSTPQPIQADVIDVGVELANASLP